MVSEELLFDGPAGARLTLVLAHGAGAPMDSPFMSTVARGVAERGFRVARFEFPYVRARRASGKRGAPDRAPVLREAWLETIAMLGGGGKLVIGGKSLGGRIASMVADEAGVRGLVVFLPAGDHSFKPPARSGRTETGNLAEAIAATSDFLSGR
jgi:predicted alpha/beta-hydrolase family hydrolase